MRVLVVLLMLLCLSGVSYAGTGVTCDIFVDDSKDLYWRVFSLTGTDLERTTEVLQLLEGNQCEPFDMVPGYHVEGEGKIICVAVFAKCEDNSTDIDAVLHDAGFLLTGAR